MHHSFIHSFVYVTVTYSLVSAPLSRALRWKLYLWRTGAAGQKRWDLEPTPCGNTEDLYCKIWRKACTFHLYFTSRGWIWELFLTGRRLTGCSEGWSWSFPAPPSASSESLAPVSASPTHWQQHLSINTTNQLKAKKVKHSQFLQFHIFRECDFT